MSLRDWWYTFRQTRLSRPVEDRCLYRATSRRDIRSVLEIGIGDGTRCQRLIHWLLRQGSDHKIRYAAIDMFEAGDGLSLKSFHSSVIAAGAKPLPMPGNLTSGLPRVAHTIGAVDLLLLSTDVDVFTEPAAASFAPRLVHEDSVIIATNAAGFLYELETPEFLAAIQDVRQAA